MQKRLLGKLKKLQPIHYIVIFLIAVIYVGATIGVINYRANREVMPPKLEIINPIEGDSYSSDSVQIQGTTAPRAKVFVNNTEVRADKDGRYSTTMPLSIGQNTFKVRVTKGKLTTEKIVTVNRVVPEPIVQETIPSSAITGHKLNNSGPESFWLLEAGTLTAAGAAWQTSRKRLQKALRS